MRTITEFFKNTIIGGFLVILPVLLLWGVFERALEMLVKIATPILHLVPKTLLSDTAEHRQLVALLLLIVASFVLGALLRAALFRRMFRWLERRSFDRLPGYKVLRSLFSEAAQPESYGGFRPAMVLLSEGMQRPAYVIEDHQDGNFTVFLPSAPAPFSGMIHVVSRERIVFLDVKLRELAASIAQYGAGHKDLLKQKRTSPGEKPPV